MGATAVAFHFGTGVGRQMGRIWKPCHGLNRVVKERHYLVDNVCCSRLSDLKACCQQ